MGPACACAPAAALVPLCLELLANEPLADDESWNSRHLRWDRATTALVALIDVADPVVLEPLLAAMRADTHRYRACPLGLKWLRPPRSRPFLDGVPIRTSNRTDTAVSGLDESVAV